MDAVVGFLAYTLLTLILLLSIGCILWATFVGIIYVISTLCEIFGSEGD